MKINQINNWFSIIVFSVISSLIFISLLGNYTFTNHGFEFLISVQIFDHGFTDINIPPIGSISAKTHKTPLKISINLQNIDLKMLQELIETPTLNKEKLKLEFIEKIYRTSKQFLIRLFFLSVLGGAFGSLIFQKKKIKPLLIGVVVGVLLFAFLIIGTFATFNPNAFQNPEFRGMLEAAPWMLGLAEKAVVHLDTLGQQFQLMAENFYTIYQKISKLESLSGSEGEIIILHVSDFHNNIVALQLTNQIVKSFGVDFIIDTGDFTDYSTPVELTLLDYLQDMSVPYIFIPGNHDSISTIEKLSNIDQVIVLNEGVVNLKGLKILGLHDPACLTGDIVPPNKELINIYREKLLKSWNDNFGNYPDIVAVHNYKIGSILAGKAELILHGHDHESKIYKEKSTIVIDAGTTGAAGIRGLLTRNEIPYTMALLHFNKINNKFVLTTVDSIKVNNLESGFILERHILNKIHY